MKVVTVSARTDCVRSRCRAVRSRTNAAVASPRPRTKASATLATPTVVALFRRAIFWSR